MPAVLPVRVRGIDEDGKPFEEIAHTLDITETGARLAIRRQLKEKDRVTVAYRQRKMEFVVVWTKPIGKHEYQIGLKVTDHQRKAWALWDSNREADVRPSQSGATLSAKL